MNQQFKPDSLKSISGTNQEQLISKLGEEETTSDNGMYEFMIQQQRNRLKDTGLSYEELYVERGFTPFNYGYDHVVMGNKLLTIHDREGIVRINGENALVDFRQDCDNVFVLGVNDKCDIVVVMDDFEMFKYNEENKNIEKLGKMDVGDFPELRLTIDLEGNIYYWALHEGKYSINFNGTHIQLQDLKNLAVGHPPILEVSEPGIVKITFWTEGTDGPKFKFIRHEIMYKINLNSPEISNAGVDKAGNDTRDEVDGALKVNSIK